MVKGALTLPEQGSLLDYIARTVEHTPTVSTPISTRKAAYVVGSINGQYTDILLDSGASCSVVHCNLIPPDHVQPRTPIGLINADGSNLTPVGITTAQVILNGLNTPHNFIVVERLSVPVILGCDFLFKNSVILDFGRSTFQCKNSGTQPEMLNLQAECLSMLVLDDDLPQAMPSTVQQSSQIYIDVPQNYHKSLESVLRDHAALFRRQLGKTNIARHVIETGDAHPVKLPSRHIPFHYTERVYNQLQEMAKEGIIRPSNSPWCVLQLYMSQKVM